jgi:hypothetical protein
LAQKQPKQVKAGEIPCCLLGVSASIVSDRSHKPFYPKKTVDRWVLAITSPASETKEKETLKSATFSPQAHANAYASLTIYNNIVINVTLGSKKADDRSTQITPEPSESSP